MIGNVLRQERERQGLTVEDIGKRTSIRAQYIEAIEEEAYQVLPGEVYTKGFIRNYATLLGLDADACVHQYVSENHPEQAAAMEAAQAVKEEEQTDFDNRKTSFAQRDGEQRSMGEAFPQEKKRSGSGFGMAVAAVALVAVLGGGAYFLLGSDGNGDPNAKTQVQRQAVSSSKPEKTGEKPVQTEAKPSVPAVPSAQAASSDTTSVKPQQPAPAASAVTAGSDVQITAKFTDRCWTRVESDGQTVYEGTVEPGKTMAWNGKERISITAGNAGALEITHNGKPLGRAGDVGQVVDKVFTKDMVN